MKKKEFLIIFILAVLVTGSTLLYSRPRGWRKLAGWPLAYRETSLVYPSWGPEHAGPGPIFVTGIDWVWGNLLFDLLFWFLVLVALYHVGYRVKRWWVVKRIKKW